MNAINDAAISGRDNRTGDSVAALAALLRARRYEVSPAGSLAAARKLFNGKVFDVLISDIGLPDGSGFELMKEIGRTGDVRGIALTGYGMEEDVKRSRAAGFYVHLTEPIVAGSLDEAWPKSSGKLRAFRLSVI